MRSMSGPGVPADRVKLLRDAFQAMLADQAFLDDVKRLGAEFDPLSGTELQKVISTATDLTPDARESAQKALTE